MKLPAITPGPWDCTGCLFPDDFMGGVYYRLQGDGMDARVANAKAIAAVPKLLEAGAGAIDAIGRLSGIISTDQMDALMQSYGKLRAALRLAGATEETSREG